MKNNWGPDGCGDVTLNCYSCFFFKSFIAGYFVLGENIQLLKTNAGILFELIELNWSSSPSTAVM